MENTPDPEDELDHQDTDVDADSSAQSDESLPKCKGKIKFESVMQRGEAATYFGALIDGLRHGQLQFRHGDQNLSLAPAQQVVVEVKASKKGDKEKVAFELEWRRSPEETVELNG
jgi:amphi-Trp domain-containing protein